MTGTAFEGFPGVSRATAIPNLFFATVLPQMSEPCELLAFLWTARLAQEKRGEARFVTADEVWSAPGASEAFERLARLHGVRRGAWSARGGWRSGLRLRQLACD